MTPRLTVWAPRASSIRVVFEDGGEEPLQRGLRDQWSCDHPIPPGKKYRFLVDGQGPFPDPRSEYQPDGVHGWSMRWNHDYPFVCTSFRPQPWSRAVVYEIHVGTFSDAGTFSGAIEHLDDLLAWGVTHIELMPLSAFPGRHGWGYDGVAPFAPHAPYGTPDDLKKLVDEAHQRGMSVILDIVFNHLGPDGNYLGIYAPYFTDRYQTPWGQAVNLDGPDSDLVRRTFVDCALYWLDTYKMDGLRLDAVHALYDKSATHFLEELSLAVDELSSSSGRDLTLIAECDLNDPKYVRSRDRGGYGLSAQWCDDFHHALHAFFTGERDGYYEDYGSLSMVKKALLQGYVFDGIWSPHRRRIHGRPPHDIARSQLIVFLQNHDQVGNRAGGDRLSRLVGRAQLFQSAALLLLSPFVPLVFQGEEWGTQRPFSYFTDHQDPTLAKNVTEGRKKEFRALVGHGGEVPDPQAEATFVASRLDWSECQRSPYREMRAWYEKLTSLRATHDLGHMHVEVDVQISDDDDWLVLSRGRVVAYFNLTDRPQSIPAWVEGRTKAELLLASHPEDLTLERDELPPHCVAIVRRAERT